MTKKTQDILNTYFTKEVKDLTLVDYNLYTQDSESTSFSSKDSNYPSLPEGTVIVASGQGHEDQEYLVVRTSDNIYHLVDEYLGLEEFDETPEVDMNTPIGELYEINHYDENSTHYHFTSYTSHTGLIIHLIVGNVDPHLGGFSTLTKDFTPRTKYSKFITY